MTADRPDLGPMGAVTPGTSGESQVIVFSDTGSSGPSAAPSQRCAGKFAEWQARLDREDLAEMLAEYRERRDAKDGGHGE